MGLRDDIKREYEALAAKASAPNPGALYGRTSSGIPTYPRSWPGWQDRGGTFGGNPAQAEERKAKVAIQNAWVYSDINAIAREFSSAVLQVLEDKGEETEAIKNHAFELLWRKPNRVMGRAFLMQFWAWQLLLSGRAFLFMAPAGNKIAEIWPIPSWMMTAEGDEEEPIRCYIFQSAPDKPKYKFDPAYICYSRLPNPFDIRGGLSPLDAAALGIDQDLAQSKWNRDFFGKDHAIPATIISVPADLPDPDFLRVQAEIMDFFTGGQRKTLITRAGEVKVDMAARGQKDSEFLGGREMNKSEIDRVFGIPEGFWSKDATRANSEGARATMIENAVWPLAVLLQEDLSAQTLPPWYGETFQAQFEDIRPRNRELELRERESKRGLWTVNQLLEDEGLEKLSGDYQDLWDTVPAVAAVEIIKSLYKDPNAPPPPPQLTGGNPAATMPPEASDDAAPAVEDDDVSDEEQDTEAQKAAKLADLERWERKTQRRLKTKGNAACDFDSAALDESEVSTIYHFLTQVSTATQVRGVFAAARKSIEEGPWSDEQILAEAAKALPPVPDVEITPGEVKRGLSVWDEVMPEDVRGLLDAGVE